MIVAQADGCAPIVRAFAAGADHADAWENPDTHASGLRVPGPLGDRLILRALRESGGDAAAVSEQAIRDDTLRLSRSTGIDAAPEGGCALAVLELLVRERRIPARRRSAAVQHGQWRVVPLLSTNSLPRRLRGARRRLYLHPHANRNPRSRSAASPAT